MSKEQNQPATQGESIRSLDAYRRAKSVEHKSLSIREKVSLSVALAKEVGFSGIIFGAIHALTERDRITRQHRVDSPRLDDHKIIPIRKPTQ